MDAAELFFLHQTPERNFAFIVQDRKLWVSKETLSLYSPVFQRMFYGDFREANVDNKFQEFPEKRFVDFVNLLRCLIPCPVRGQVDRQNFTPLMQLADEYEIDDLKCRCSKVLISVLNDFTNNDRQVGRFFAYFDLAVCYRYKNAVEQFLPIAAYHCRNGLVCNVAEYPADVKATIESVISARKLYSKHELDMSTQGRMTSCKCVLKRNHHRCKKCFKAICPRDHYECSSFHKYNCKNRHAIISRSNCLCGYTTV